MRLNIECNTIYCKDGTFSFIWGKRHPCARGRKVADWLAWENEVSRADKIVYPAVEFRRGAQTRPLQAVDSSNRIADQLAKPHFGSHQLGLYAVSSLKRFLFATQPKLATI